MLVCGKGFLKCRAPGVPFFCDKRKSFFTKTKRGFHSLPLGTGVRVYFNNNLRYSSNSIEVVEKAAINMGSKEDKADNPALSSYDDAMEALSTLISRRNRGDRTPTKGNRDKLEQVVTYLKVIQPFTVKRY